MKNLTAWMFAYYTPTNASETMFYVSADGNYGSDDILLVPLSALTQKQLDIIGELHDSQRVSYVKAILDDKEQAFLDDHGIEVN